MLLVCSCYCCFFVREDVVKFMFVYIYNEKRRYHQPLSLLYDIFTDTPGYSQTPTLFPGSKIIQHNSTLVSSSYQEHDWIPICLPSEEAAILRNSLGRAQRNRKEHNFTYSFYFCIYLVTIYFCYYVYFCECVGVCSLRLS